MVYAQVGNEFPDMRQNEGRIKFIRVGDTVRTEAGSANFYGLKTENSYWKGSIR